MWRLAPGGWQPRPTPGRQPGHSRPWRGARERCAVAARSTWACDPCASHAYGPRPDHRCTLHDPLAFVLRQGAQERDEAATDGRGEVQVWLVEDLDHGAPGVNPLEDGQATYPRPTGRVSC